MTEQNGIDILCDAAGSDLLLGSVFPTSSTPHETPQRPSACPEQPPSSALSQRTKRVKLDDDNPGASPHVCHICKRVYERADHLTRHLRSHENARPYQCSRCPKRFNRADLLTRHETTHDRDQHEKGKSIVRRSDRAAEACVNCAASKAKCDDQKPCGRCKSKNLRCHTATRKALAYGEDLDGTYLCSFPSPNWPRDASGAKANKLPDQSTASPVDSPIASTTTYSDHHTAANGASDAFLMQPHGVPTVSIGQTNPASGPSAVSYMADFAAPASNVLMHTMVDDMFFCNPTHTFFQDMDFSSWDLNFDNYTIPQLDRPGPSPQSSSASQSRHSHIQRDPSRGHAAFKRSPWLWEPKSRDCFNREQQGITLKEESIAGSPAYEKLLTSSQKQWKMSTTDRDGLFAIVLAQHKDPSKVPSFPSLDLLNYLLQTHFAQDDYQTDSWIHASSFDPGKSRPELLAALIARGALFIAVPSIWQFGLALQEVVRASLSVLVSPTGCDSDSHVQADLLEFESRNANTRDLQCLQAFMQVLDIGLWSGFKRKMEISESFLQPLMTMLRRAGTFSAPADTAAFIPSMQDSSEVLEQKWHSFIKRESYKRLVLHIFFHDVQASISLQKNPLMSFTELSFSLPASRDLWKAPNAKAWRDVYIYKQQHSPETTPPRMSEIQGYTTILDTDGAFVDVELCCFAMLCGYWGQIAAYREAVKFYARGLTPNTQRNATNRLWLTSQHQELYRDISDLSILIGSSQNSSSPLSIVAELFMMILHVHPDELQRFAGKYGEEDARKVAVTLEETWAGTREARHAVWHAGQVIRNARMLPPASLRGFDAIAVYFASLTLWIYGLLYCSNTARVPDGVDMPAPPKYILLDGEETRDTRAFLQLDKGMPGICFSSDPHAGAESLSNPGMVLEVARNVFRDNYPVRSEPLPPLVESLENLLNDLGTGTAGFATSRAASDNSS